jgi:hypothetical protein
LHLVAELGVDPPGDERRAQDQQEQLVELATQ